MQHLWLKPLNSYYPSCIFEQIEDKKQSHKSIISSVKLKKEGNSYHKETDSSTKNHVYKYPQLIIF